MLGYLSADSENCSRLETDNVRGQISEHIFSPNGGYCLFYPSNIFKQGRTILETFSENYFTSKQLYRRSKYFHSIKNVQFYLREQFTRDEN